MASKYTRHTHRTPSLTSLDVNAHHSQASTIRGIGNFCVRVACDTQQHILATVPLFQAFQVAEVINPAPQPIKPALNKSGGVDMRVEREALFLQSGPVRLTNPGSLSQSSPRSLLRQVNCPLRYTPVVGIINATLYNTCYVYQKNHLRRSAEYSFWRSRLFVP